MANRRRRTNNSDYVTSVFGCADENTLDLIRGRHGGHNKHNNAHHVYSRYERSGMQAERKLCGWVVGV